MLTIKREVKLTHTAHDWALYANQLGAEDAASVLNWKFEEFVNSGMERDEVKRRMYSVMDIYEQLGAHNTEPQWILRDLLNRVFGKTIGD
jgi:hypothetical protein